MINQHQPRDIPQILLSVLFLSLIIISCLWVVQPFILSFAWAGTVVIATWPVLLRLQKLLFGKRSLAVLGGIGLAISGVPYAALLTVVMIFTCLVQLGPLIVLVPSIIWLYWTGDTTWGTVLLVWSCVVGTMDNVIRPVLIRMGADLPMILILSGVIGGLIAFGMIGLFIGPVLLAVSWRLYDAWVQEVPPPPLDPDLVLAELAELNASHNKSEK